MLAFLVAATIIAAVAALIDFRTGHIPNWLTLGALLLAPAGHVANVFVRHAGATAALFSVGWSLAGATMCFVVLYILYVANATGGGDVKLFAAIGALVHPSLALDTLLAAFSAFVVLSAFVLWRRGRLGQMLRNTRQIVKNRFLPMDARVKIEQRALNEVRMGPAIFVGTVIVLAENVPR